MKKLYETAHWSDLMLLGWGIIQMILSIWCIGTFLTGFIFTMWGVSSLFKSNTMHLQQELLEESIENNRMLIEMVDDLMECKKECKCKKK